MGLLVMLHASACRAGHEARRAFALAAATPPDLETSRPTSVGRKGDCPPAPMRGTDAMDMAEDQA